jgi:hypothetical protein
MKTKNFPKNYIITTAQKGAKPFAPFLKGLETCAKFYDAEILVQETNGQQTTSRRGKDANEDEALDPYFTAHHRIVLGELPLNENVAIRHFPVKAQQMQPFTSFERFVPPGKTSITASPKQMMICRPHSIKDYPRIFVSTGAVTLPNYRDNRWGNIAKLDHQFGAVLVEVEGPHKYHFRVLNADQNGVFYDLGMRFDGDKKPVFEREEVMVLGDWHEGLTLPEVIGATETMIKRLKPKKLVIHDLFDGDAISFFNERDLLARTIQSKLGTDRLDKALGACGERLGWFRQICPRDTEIVVVKSNHDERLDKYTKEGKFAQDDTNRAEGCRLFLAMEAGEDPLVNGITRNYGKIPAGVTFLKRENDFKVLGWVLGVHGDPSSGQKWRLSASALEKSYGKVIAGHTHSPEIVREVMRVGTSTSPWMDYQRGRPSDGLNSHALLPRNGKPQLVNMINGDYTCH